MAYPTPASSFTQSHSEIEIEIEAEGQPSPRSLDLNPAPSFGNDASSFAPSTSTAAHPNENSSDNYKCEIFINHRGPDVKKTFASHLYSRLLPYGVRAFLDYQEMQEGEKITDQIEAAIATATVHVAIFSPGYAESHWCLDELLSMQDSRAPIIPVFYNVRPASLRRKDGVYAQALHNLKEKKMYDAETRKDKPRYDFNTIENWRNALHSVSEISGFELHACRDELELLDKLVECLLKNVRRMSFYGATYPTGVDEKLKHLDDFLLQQPNEKPKIVGIVGLGGVGKTTLVKELFNRKSPYYGRSCFLDDVGRRATEGSLHDLQSKLLGSMAGFAGVIHNIDEGKQILQRIYLQNRSLYSRSLVILDDVANVDQLDALFPREVKGRLPSDCLILFTSRDSILLERLGGRLGVRFTPIYKLTGLNTQFSTELFCHHAFCKPHPAPGFQCFVDKISSVCDGLPLSLKVFGAHLSAYKDKSQWEDQLRRLQRLLPADIEQILKISFDSLDEEEQQIFLDIACFLIGEKRDACFKLWEQSGLTGSVGFQNLQFKCLVDVDSENCIHMHNHLIQLGRKIAEDSEICISCLLDQTENMDIAKLQQKLKISSDITKVRGIRMVPSAYVGNDGFKYYESLQSGFPSIKKKIHGLLGKGVMKLCNRQHNTMPNLQLLVAEDHLMEAILRTARLPNLRWLRWYKCAHSSLPSWIPKEDLRILNVVGSALKILWRGKAQAPLKLRELEIWAPLSKFPKSIGTLKHLQQIYINLPKENNMRSLPDEFCELSSLKRFELINARKMNSLPRLIGNLTNLEHLNLLFSHSLERLPNSFENLSSLTYLDLRGTSKLMISTKAPENVPCLAFFHLSRDMRRTKERMAQIMTWTRTSRAGREAGRWTTAAGKPWRADRAKCLEAGWSAGWKTFWTVGFRERGLLEFREAQWRNWKEMEACWAELEACWAEREEWWKMGWEAASKGGFAWAVSEAHTVTGGKAERGERAARSAVQEMAREEWQAEREREDIMKHERSCGNAELLPLQLPRSLQELHIKELPSTIGNLGKLEFLELEGSLLKMLPPSLSDLSSLKKLRLVNCLRLEFLPDFLRPLTELEVKSCHRLLDVGTLPNTLVQLNISGCREVEELKDLETLVFVEELRASGCEKLKRIRGLAQLTKLRLLDVSGCSKIEELEGVENLRSLEKLDATGCSNLNWDSGLLEQLPQRLKEGMLYI